MFTKPDPSEPLSKPPPVAKKLGYKTPNRAFWETVRKHDVPRYQINQRLILFRMSEIEAWLAERRKGAVV